jgi:hypothetical protein
MNLIDRIKEHWVGGLVAFTALCIGTTWIIVNELLVKPRDFTIEQQKTTIAELRDRIKEGPAVTQAATASAQPPGVILRPTRISVNQPILALDGQVLIRVSSPSGTSHSASFDLQVADQPPITWASETVGTRKTFTYKGESYLFDILDVSDFGAQVSISKKQ